MHFKNGRVAQNGDKVVFLSDWGNVLGILYDAKPGNDHCNGKLAPISPNDPTPDLKECLHVDDVKASIAGFLELQDNFDLGAMAELQSLMTEHAASEKAAVAPGYRIHPFAELVARTAERAGHNDIGSKLREVAAGPNWPQLLTMIIPIVLQILSGQPINWPALLAQILQLLIPTPAVAPVG